MEVWVKYVSNATICESVIFHNWKGRRLQHGQWGVALASEGLHPARATGWFKSLVLSLKLSLKHYSSITVDTITQTLLNYHANYTQTILYYRSGWFESHVLSLKHYSNYTVLSHKHYCTVAQVGLSLLYYHAPFALAFLLAIGFSVVQTTGVFFNNYLNGVD